MATEIDESKTNGSQHGISNLIRIFRLIMEEPTVGHPLRMRTAPLRTFCGVHSNHRIDKTCLDTDRSAATRHRRKFTVQTLDYRGNNIIFPRDRDETAE